jgi:hypothetical protein
MALKRVLPIVLACFGLFVLVLVSQGSGSASAQPVAAPQAQDVPQLTSTPFVCGGVGDYAVGISTATVEPATDNTGLYCDDCGANVNLPFSFRLYDQTFTSTYIGSNGVLIFGGGDNSFANACLPTNHAYTIFPYWDDLRVDDPGLGVFTAVAGTAPNRRFIIEWRATYFSTSGQGGTAHFEVRLHENGGSNQYFDVIYGPMDLGNTSATIGVQQSTAFFTQYACNSTGGPVTDTLQLTFTQLPCASATPSITGTPYTSTPMATPTASNTGTPPTATLTPTRTHTPLPTTTSSLGCSLGLRKATSTCYAPNTFQYSFDWIHTCGVPTQGYLYFEIATTSSGPWVIHDQQGPMGYPINGSFIENDIPPGYSWYRFRAFAAADPPHYGWQGQTPPKPICGGFGPTATPTSVPADTSTPTATATSTTGPSATATNTALPNVWPGAVWISGCLPAVLDITTHSDINPPNMCVGPSTMRLTNSDGDYVDRAVPAMCQSNNQSYTISIAVGNSVPYTWIYSQPYTLTVDYYNEIAESNEADNTMQLPLSPPCGSPTAVPTATLAPTGTPPSATATPTQCAIEFTDVPVGSTFYPFVRCMACMGIINGYSTGCETGNPCFRPGNNVTRGQLSKIVSNAAGFDDDPGGRQFEDVAEGSTFYDFVQRLANRGIVSGYACGPSGEPCVPPGNLPYFRPNARVTRGQISKIVSEAAGYSDPPGAQQFEDVVPGSTFYDWIWRLADRGIMSGYACGGAGEPCVPPGNRPYFRPGNHATRGQASKIVANTFFPDCELAGR